MMYEWVVGYLWLNVVQNSMSLHPSLQAEDTGMYSENTHDIIHTHACTHARTHTYIHTYIHTYTHTYHQLSSLQAFPVM